MGLFVGKPWREVTHIEHRVGPQGGPYWMLTLSCGHLRAYSKPNPPPERAIFMPISRFLAPKRLRCLHCK